jgi:hypothetical protein
MRSRPRRTRHYLADALVAGICGEDVYYAGYPQPGAATRALADAWRGQPDATVAIVEAGAAATVNRSSTTGRSYRWYRPTVVPLANAVSSAARCTSAAVGSAGKRTGLRRA